MSSCVTPKMYNSVVSEKEKVELALNEKEKNVLSLTSQLDELNGDITRLSSDISKLKSDSIQNGTAFKRLKKNFDSLNESYDLLTSKSSRQISEKAKETKRLLLELENTQSELFAKEDELLKLSNTLAEKQEALNLSKEKLNARSERVAELELIINKKDSIVTSLKQSISKALIGLEGDGLSIEQRNGKVYVSLEEELLFASGKYKVNTSGKAALTKLAIALSPQKELEILVEGHTDSIPFNGKGLVSDNWDLSVMRATNVVKVLTQNSDLNPVQLTAAGRAEYVPILSNASSEGRSANRRIEIILAPRLDDLYKILED